MKEPRILIIEDYKDFQKALEIQLKNDGFDVITADDGYQGYDAFCGQPASGGRSGAPGQV